MQQTASNYAPQGNPNGYMQQQPVCQGNYAGMPTPMDFYKIISVSQESMRYQGFLLSQNAQLAQYNLNLQFENAKLNLKKGDILDKERLVDDGSRLSYCVEYDDFNSRSTVVAKFFIKSAVMLKWDPRYKKEDGYLLMMSDNRSILIYKKDIEKGKLSRLFNFNGYSFNSIRGRDLEPLLVNYIANKLDQSEENICYIPYTTGWVGKSHYMFPNNVLQNTEMPFGGPLGNKTFEVADASIDESLKKGFSCYNFIKDEKKRVILLGMLISSLLYTRLKNKNKELRKILVVSGEKIF